MGGIGLKIWGYGNEFAWEVLPTDLKLDIQQSIQREYEWVLAELNPSKIAESNTP